MSIKKDKVTEIKDNSSVTLPFCGVGSLGMFSKITGVNGEDLTLKVTFANSNSKKDETLTP